LELQTPVVRGIAECLDVRFPPLTGMHCHANLLSHTHTHTHTHSRMTCVCACSPTLDT
jgi:hypothetical protein